MRSVSFFIIVSVFLMPIAAYAAIPNAALPAHCPKGAPTGNPSSEKTFTSAQRAEMKSYMDTITYCANACFNVKVSLSVKDDGSVVFKTSAEDLCKDKTKQPFEQEPPRGCAAKQVQPKITASVPAVTMGAGVFKQTLVPAETVGPKSRCDATISEIVGTMLGRSENSDLEGYKRDLASLRALNGEVTPPLINPLDPAQYAEVLKAYGMTDEERIQEVIRTKPDSVKALADCAAGASTCTEQTLKSAVSDVKLALNEDLKSPSQFKAEWEEQQKKEQEREGPPGQERTGFAAGPNRAVAEAAEEICARVGGCGYACDTNPNRLVCQTNNPGAIVCSSVARQFGAVGCHPNNNTAIFPSVEHGAAAMAKLLSSSSRYFANGDKGILQALCSGYSSSNCQEYANFVARQVGISPMQTIDPKDSTMLAKIMTAMSRFENGNGAIFTPSQLQNAFAFAFDSKIPEGTEGYLARFASGVPGMRFQSPLSFGADNYVSGAGIGSPFSSVNPFSGYRNTSAGYPVSTGSPVSTGGAISTGGTGQTQTPVSAIIGGTGNAPVRTPASTIVVYPKEILKGNAVAVSWTSVGMTTTPACRVLIASSTSAVLAQGNEGSKTIRLGSVGTYTLTLECKAVSGADVRQSASVLVQ